MHEGTCSNRPTYVEICLSFACGTIIGALIARSIQHDWYYGLLGGLTTTWALYGPLRSTKIIFAQKRSLFFDCVTLATFVSFIGAWVVSLHFIMTITGDYKPLMSISECGILSIGIAILLVLGLGAAHWCEEIYNWFYFKESDAMSFPLLATFGMIVRITTNRQRPNYWTAFESQTTVIGIAWHTLFMLLRPASWGFCMPIMGVTLFPFLVCLLFLDIAVTLLLACAPSKEIGFMCYAVAGAIIGTSITTPHPTQVIFVGIGAGIISGLLIAILRIWCESNFKDLLWELEHKLS